MAARNGKPKAYSYLRFSTPEQAQGDSFRRQTEAAQDYAARNGLDLDSSLTFRDLGVSAYRGANAVEGQLGRFIEAVDGGRIAPGSYLLVENLDRLSRDRIMAALNRFSSLLERGVKVVTLSDGKVYDSDSLNNLPDLMLSLLVMSRAHEESETKSRRIRAAWQKKRERAADGEALTAKAPAWLRLQDGSFVVLTDRAAVLRRVFEMALDGHGKSAIARQLNTDGVEPFGDGPSLARKADGWHSSYIQKIIRNPAVIGRFQPMRQTYDPATGKKVREPDGPPIEDYFPAVVDPDVFYRVNHARPARSGHGGAPLANLLSGLVVCLRCGGRMHYVNKGAPPRGGAYLACDNARRKRTCTAAKSVRYDVVLAAVLGSLEDGDLDFSGLLDSGPRDRRHELEARLAALDGRASETEAAVQNLLAVLERRPSPAVEKRLAELEVELSELPRQRRELEDEMHVVVGTPGRDAVEVAREVRRIVGSAGGIDAATASSRARFNSILKGAIEKIELAGTDEERAEGRAWFDSTIDASGGRLLADDAARADYAAVIAKAGVVISVTFRGDTPILLNTLADPRRPGRFVSGVMRSHEGKLDKLRGLLEPDMELGMFRIKVALG